MPHVLVIASLYQKFFFPNIGKKCIKFTRVCRVIRGRSGKDHLMQNNAIEKNSKALRRKCVWFSEKF